MRSCYHFVMKQTVYNEELCVMQYSFTTRIKLD